MPELRQEYLDILEKREWSVSGYTDDGRVELEWWSPAGEDFLVCVNVENFPDEILDYSDDFDPDEHIEHRTMVVHNHPECKSRVVYKGALDGKGAHSTWVGNALIQPTAPGTDSYELNRNLVLTPGAIADSEPNLEIENGNIIGAGHASSVGRFDDEELFYLESRGISENEARKLVVRGFFGELVEEIGIPAISEHLMNVIDKRLARGESDAIAQVLEEK